MHSPGAQAPGGANNTSTKPSNAAPAAEQLNALSLTPFVDPLPLPTRLLATGHAPVRLTMREVHAPLHRDLPPARLWAYTSAADPGNPLAPVLEAGSYRPLRIEWINSLPTKHFLPIDYTLHGCGRDLPQVRTSVHMHGARTRSSDDGYPEDWYAPGHRRTCLYPLEQESCALWFHDHAMGLNRLNLYAGLFGQMLVRDEAEDALKLPAGPDELPIILTDRNITRDGQLLYPVSDDPEHPWVSEFTGDAILLNGKIRPYTALEPRLYRLRLLNASNSRFFGLSFTSGKLFHMIGADQGLLAAPVPLTHLTLAPAERADLLLDLTAHAGETLHLRTGALDILEIRVVRTSAATSSTSAPKAIPTRLRSVSRLAESEATQTRSITLNEYQDKVGNSMVMLLNRKHWHEPVTETPQLGTTEIWEFVNLTEDTHPMHLHLVRFQILDRRPFDTFAYLMHGERHYTGKAAIPAAHEASWKDVVQCPAGTVTRIAARFEGYPGKYLYHCHILEHEANDMMRPFEVRSA